MSAIATTKVRYSFIVLLFLIASCSGDELPPLQEVTYIFWTSLGDLSIERGTVRNGEVVERKVLYDELKGVESPSCIVADESTGSIYWTDYTNRQILKAPWDGTGNPEVLYTTSHKGKGPLELLVDQKSNMLYWSHPHDNLLFRAPADGSGGIDTIFSKKNGLHGPWGMGLAPKLGYLYWVEYEDVEVWRASTFDLSLPELIYAGGSGMIRPYGIVVCEETDELYILDNPLPGSILSDRILKGNLNGTMKLKELYSVNDGLENAYSMVMGPDYQLYWHNQLINGSIYQVGLEYNEKPKLILDGINVGQGIAIVKTMQEVLLDK